MVVDTFRHMLCMPPEKATRLATFLAGKGLLDKREASL
jgi:hypothetical protein